MFPPRFLLATMLVVACLTGATFAAEPMDTATFHRSPLHPMGNLDFMLEALSRPGAYYEYEDADSMNPTFGFAVARRKPVYVLVDHRPSGDRSLSAGWKAGPPPANTFWFGGVVLKAESHSEGFHFADFRGDHVKLDSSNGRRVEFSEIAFYTNPIYLPHRMKTSITEAAKLPPIEAKYKLPLASVAPPKVAAVCNGPECAQAQGQQAARPFSGKIFPRARGLRGFCLGCR